MTTLKEIRQWQYEWAASVRRSKALSAWARLLAECLVFDYWSHSTGQCNPGRDTLARHLGTSESTIKRAVAELQKAGVIAITGAPGKGKSAAYRLLPQSDNVVPFTSRNRQNEDHARPEIAHDDLRASAPSAGHGRPAKEPTRVKTEANAGHGWPAPYKGRNHDSNQGARAAGERPACPVLIRVVVKSGDRREAAWNEWLTAHGWPTVAALGIRASDAQGAGYAMPLTYPPKDGDSIETSITERFLSWATARMIERREGVA